MNSLTICSQNINVVDNLYSLNDLHKASGKQNKHRPTFFLQNQETKELIAEIESENSSVGNPTVALKVINGGLNRGTYVCKELVYRYAMWISAKFSLMVIRAFDSMVIRSDSQQREILVKACSKLAIGNMLISEVYTIVGKQFGYEGGIKDIPTSLLPEAIAFVYEMILRLNKSEVINTNPNAPYAEQFRVVGREANDDSRRRLNLVAKQLDEAQRQMRALLSLNGLTYDCFVEVNNGFVMTPEQRQQGREQAKKMLESYVNKGLISKTSI